MMAFIEQEANEKAEEIDAKVRFFQVELTKGSCYLVFLSTITAKIV